MRVCVAAYPTAFQQPGGGERVLDALSEALRREVDIVERFDPWTTKLADFDVLHYFSSYGSELFPEWRRHVDVLAVTPFIWPELPPMLAARRQAERFIRRAVRRERGPFQSVDVLFPTSKSEAKLLIRNYGVRPDRVVPVPHGTDPRFAAPPSGAFAARFGVTDFVLCPARIDANKNQLRLIRALSETDLKLVLLGDVAVGHERYGAACRAAAGPNTTMLPSLAHQSEELRDAFASAACVVIPSEYELCSVAALEAGIAGTPLASTTGGGMVDHLSPYAEFFDPRSEDDIRDALLRAIAVGRRPGQREHFAARFSWQAVARRTVDAYRRCLP